MELHAHIFNLISWKLGIKMLQLWRDAFLHMENYVSCVESVEPPKHSGRSHTIEDDNLK